MNERPMLGFHGMDAVELQPAAAPQFRLEDRKTEFTFICPGMPGMGARLGWSGSSRILELLFTFNSIVLEQQANIPIENQVTGA